MIVKLLCNILLDFIRFPFPVESSLAVRWDADRSLGHFVAQHHFLAI